MGKNLTTETLEAVGRVLGKTSRPVALHEPSLGAIEKKWLAECIDSGWVSSAGPFIEKFEKEIIDDVELNELKREYSTKKLLS